MEITSSPWARAPLESPRARPGLEVRWSRPSAIARAPGSRSRRYAPKPPPSAWANSGVSSVAVSPRMSYSRKTCTGTVIASSPSQLVRPAARLERVDHGPDVLRAVPRHHQHRVARIDHAHSPQADRGDQPPAFGQHDRPGAIDGDRVARQRVPLRV